MIHALGLLVATCFASSTILTLPHRAVTLPNGLKLVWVKYPSPGVVAYQLPVHVGSRNEIEKGKTGFAHFFEHLMFRGTKTRSSDEFGQIYNRLGCENNAWTSNEMTNYHGVVASVYLPQILDAEADRFMNLSFDEKALKDEAGAVLGEYNKDVAQPEFQIEEKLASTAFRVHPYGHTTMGYKEDIVKFTERYQDVWPFFKRYYRPENVSVILVGDIEFAQAKQMVESKFGKWKASRVEPVTIPQEPPQIEAREAEIRLNKPTQTRITVAYKVPAFTTQNRDSAALSVLGEMFFSVTSDFQKEFRFNKKWLDSVEIGQSETIDPYLWSINLRFSKSGEGHEDDVLKALHETLDGVRKSSPPEGRVEDTKKRFKNAMMTSWFDTPDGLAGRVAWYTNFESDLGVLDRVFESWSQVTPAYVQQVAQKYLVNSGKTTVALHGKQD